MTTLQRRIERLEQRSSAAKEGGIVLVIAPAGAKIGPDQQQYIDNLAERGPGMVLLDMTKLSRAVPASK